MGAPREGFHRNAAPRTVSGRCCARCRRGVPGYGILPCGYEGACPNDCHNMKGNA